jgi:hypothetical protein
MTARIKFRRDDAATWTSNNPILALGEPGFETDTNKLKIGDGTTVWADLEYTSGGASGSLSVEMVTQRLYDTLQSSMPSWLTTDNRGVWTEGVNWGFDTTGLWFQGDLSDNNNNAGPDPQVSFPVFTNFVVPYGTDVTVGFDFTPEVFNEENWSDHGICAYVDGTDPIWNWQNQLADIVVARFDSQYLELDGVPGSTTDTITDGMIVAGTEYHMEFTYNSRNTFAEVVVFKASDWYNSTGNPVIVKSISNNNLLGENSIRIGFAADPDTPDARSYYKNLSIEFQDNNDVSGLPITLDATFTPDGQLKLPGDMILGNVRDEDYVLWAPKGAEYAGIWWGGDRENNNNNGYGPDGSVTVGYDSNDDNDANDNAVGVRVALTAKTKSWTFDEMGSFAGPDGTVTVKGDITVGGEPLGWISTEGVVPNTNNDLWFDHVLKDAAGNVYAIGGTYNNNRRVQVVKYNSSGAIEFQKQFQVIDGSDCDVTSAELNADGTNITAVMRYYDPSANDGQGYWFGGIIVIDTSNGNIVSFDSVTNNANNDFELLDIDFDSNGDIVYVGQASPNPVEYTVASADTKPGSTSNILRVDPTVFNGAIPQPYQWKVGGDGLSGEKWLNSVQDIYNYPTYTSTGDISSAAFRIVSDFASYQHGYYVDILSYDNTHTPAVDEVITVLGSQLGGIDGGRITPSTMYSCVPGSGNGTYLFDTATYPTMDQDIINGSFARLMNGGGYGVVTNVANVDNNWVFTIDLKVGSDPATLGEVRFYSGNDFTARVGYINPPYFSLTDFDGCPQLDYIQLTFDAQGYDFSSADSTWTVYNYSNANALLKTANWEKTYGGTNDYEVWEHVIVDSNDNVYAATNAPLISGSRWAITKFSSDGSVQWTRTYFEENNYFYIGCLTVDQNDNLIVTGEDNNGNGVILKIGTDGEVIWYQYTDMGNFNSWDWNNRLTAVVDSGNNILVSASLNVYNSGPYNTQGYDLFIAHINGSDGSTDWSRFLGTENDDYDSYDWEGYHLTTRGDSFNVVFTFEPYNNNAMVAQLPLNGDGLGQHGIYNYRDAGINNASSSCGYNDEDIGITGSDVVVRTTGSVAIDETAGVETSLLVVTSTDGGNVSGVRSLSFDDGTTMTTAAKGPDSTWTNQNGNQWRIETYNGGFSGYYNGSDRLEWWNASYSPSGDNNWRGAIIEYHAFVGNGTIIGTIHIANDYQQYGEVTHTENISGGGNTNGWIFWDAGEWSRGQLFVRNTSGNDNDISVQWTARMFYGSESNC